MNVNKQNIYDSIVLTILRDQAVMNSWVVSMKYSKKQLNRENNSLGVYFQIFDEPTNFSQNIFQNVYKSI